METRKPKAAEQTQEPRTASSARRYRKLSATEKLARDICWAGFHDTKSAGTTKTKYWEQISPNSRKLYCEHAAELIWWTRRLGCDRLALALSEHDQVSAAKATGAA